MRTFLSWLPFVGRRGTKSGGGYRDHLMKVGGPVRPYRMNLADPILDIKVQKSAGLDQPAHELIWDAEAVGLEPIMGDRGAFRAGARTGRGGIATDRVPRSCWGPRGPGRV